MKTISELNQSILDIISNIRENHPELLKYFNELNVTIPDDENPEINHKILSSYYDSLLNILHDYDRNFKNLNFNTIENSSITKTIDMRSKTPYQNLLLEINHTFFSYNDLGEGSVPIIFLHGFPFDKSMWNEQIDYLKSNNRVIALDIRGFGKSKDENSDLSIDLFAEDLVAFMDKLKIEKAVICGLSMGGFIALNAIKRFPERFESLILCDTQCFADMDEVKKNRYISIDQINKDGTDDFNEKFIKKVFHPTSLTEKSETVEYLRNIVEGNSDKVITAGLNALAERSETCSILNTIKIPTLIICGREDKVTPLVHSEFMHQHINDSVLKVIDEAGHVSNLEKPNEFNQYLEDFLNSLSI